MCSCPDKLSGHLCLANGRTPAHLSQPHQQSSYRDFVQGHAKPFSNEYLMLLETICVCAREGINYVNL